MSETIQSRTVVVEATGGPETLVAKTVEVPPPGEGEVRIRQVAAGVNFIDTYHRGGVYPLPSLPHGIGVEAAGFVDAVGPGVTGLSIGDPVAYVWHTPGAYAAHRIVPARYVLALPDGVEPTTAAAILLKGMTVEYLVQRTFPVEPGMTVLWHAAAGGVGRLACRWLSDLGATVIGTVSTDEKAAEARANGCAHTIVYTREDFADRVLELTDGAGVPAVFDAVGRSTLDGSLRCLRRRGTLVSFGNASGTPRAVDPLELSRHGSLYLTRPTLFDYTSTRDELEASASAVFDRLARGVLDGDPSRTYDLERAGDAHRALEGRETTGSVALRSA